MANGMMFNYEYFNKGCRYNVYDGTNSKALKNVCVALITDVNGKKPPNMEGKDIFKFWVTKTGIIPAGSVSACNGLDCTLYVVTHKTLFKGAKDRESLIKDKIEEQDNTGCAISNGKVCKKCYPEYILKEKSCVPLEKLNCKSTTDGRTCSECMENYEIDNGECKETKKEIIPDDETESTNITEYSEFDEVIN